MNVDDVLAALQKGGTQREAAKLLGISHTSLQWWLAKNGYQVKRVLTLVPVNYIVTDDRRVIRKES